MMLLPFFSLFVRPDRLDRPNGRDKPDQRDEPDRPDGPNRPNRPDKRNERIYASTHLRTKLKSEQTRPAPFPTMTSKIDQTNQVDDLYIVHG
jgi:hypothetical protein